MFDSFGIWGQARHTDGGQAPHSATTTADKKHGGQALNCEFLHMCEMSTSSEKITPSQKN